MQERSLTPKASLTALQNHPYCYLTNLNKLFTSYQKTKPQDNNTKGSKFNLHLQVFKKIKIPEVFFENYKEQKKCLESHHEKQLADEKKDQSKKFWKDHEQIINKYRKDHVQNSVDVFRNLVQKKHKFTAEDKQRIFTTDRKNVFLKKLVAAGKIPNYDKEELTQEVIQNLRTLAGRPNNAVPVGSRDHQLLRRKPQSAAPRPTSTVIRQNSNSTSSSSGLKVTVVGSQISKNRPQNSSTSYANERPVSGLPRMNSSHNNQTGGYLRKSKADNTESIENADNADQHTVDQLKSILTTTLGNFTNSGPSKENINQNGRYLTKDSSMFKEADEAIERIDISLSSKTIKNIQGFFDSVKKLQQNLLITSPASQNTN